MRKLSLQNRSTKFYRSLFFVLTINKNYPNVIDLYLYIGLSERELMVAVQPQFLFDVVDAVKRNKPRNNFSMRLGQSENKAFVRIEEI